MNFKSPPGIPRQSRQSDYLTIWLSDNLWRFFDFPVFFSVLGVLSFQIGLDRPNFKSYCVSDPKLAVGARPELFRATFRTPKKSATAKNTSFASDGYNRFMKPSWVRTHGLIFRKVYIVCVCAPPYSPLSSPRSRIRENSALSFGPNFAILSGGIFYPVVFFNSVHPVEK